MAIFGGGMFGKRPSWMTPGIGDQHNRDKYGIPSTHTWPTEEVPEPGGGPVLEPKKKKRSILPYALAAIEDTLSRQMGYQPQGVARLDAMQAQQRQAAAAQAAEQRKRSLDWQDWQRKKQWELENRPEPNNDTVNDVRWWMNATPEERAAHREMNPIIERGPDGRYYTIPVGGQAAPPRAPVGRLTPIPGGTAGNGGGGF